HLFAPTNDAIERHRKETSKSTFALALDGGESQTLADNVQELLRQDSFYHLLNYTLHSVAEQGTPQLTFHFFALPFQPPTGNPPPPPPWLPVPGGLLEGVEPQRLRTTVRDGASSIGVDYKGQGGARTVKDLVSTANGIIYGIDRVLDTPRDLFRKVSSRLTSSQSRNSIAAAQLVARTRSKSVSTYTQTDGASQHAIMQRVEGLNPWWSIQRTLEDFKGVRYSCRTDHWTGDIT
ncbi:hypothetical protein FS837_005814, partial [Tulasnella sp. UAMH 9824]